MIFCRSSVLLLFILQGCISSQQEAIDPNTLEKYSYYFYGWTNQCREIDGVKQCRIVEATGFFLKKNNQMYFVSAAHSLFDLQHKGDPALPYKYPTEFQVRIYSKNTLTPVFVKLDLSSQHPPKDYFYHNPDVYCAKVNIPNGYEVNSIERFLVTGNKIDSPKDEGIMFSYPADGIFNEDKKADRSTYSLQSYYDSLSITENLGENLAGIKMIDGKVGQGSSGGPLFILSDTYSPAFGGLCIGNHSGRIVFVRPKDLLRLLN